jgi:hypothetical protein
VPYFQNFSAITQNNEIPGCWASSNPSITCLTYTQAPKMAAFFNTPAGVNYFYTNGHQLNAGVSYSLSLWYKTDANGGANWTDLSVLYGLNQGIAGLTSIVSTGGPALSQNYTALSGTFTVPNTSLNYLAVRGTGTSGTSPYLYWDELHLEAPCNLGSNTPTIGISSSASSSVLCSGQTVTFTASGANSYYWSTGTTGSVLVAPASTSLINLSVIGTNGITGCTNTANQFHSLNPTPTIGILSTANNNEVCIGQTVTLTGTGASNYTWSTNSNLNSIQVSPSVTTSYTLTGSNSQLCAGQNVITISVNALPNLSLSASSYSICEGEPVEVIASGASSYTWVSNNLMVIGSQHTLTPNATTSYTVTGKDLNDCVSTGFMEIYVNTCLSIQDWNIRLEEIEVFPNPFDNYIEIKWEGKQDISITISDVTGKVILERNLQKINPKVDLQDATMEKGVYFLDINFNDKKCRRLLVKQ